MNQLTPINNVSKDASINFVPTRQISLQKSNQLGRQTKTKIIYFFVIDATSSFKRNNFVIFVNRYLIYFKRFLPINEANKMIRNGLDVIFVVNGYL